MEKRQRSRRQMGRVVDDRSDIMAQVSGRGAMPGSRGSEEAAKIGTLNTAARQRNLKF